MQPENISAELMRGLTTACAELMQAEGVCDATVIEYDEHQEVAFLKIEDDYRNEYQLTVCKPGDTWVIWLHEAESELTSALEYALPLLQKYGHTQGDNEVYHAELIKPVVNALNSVKR